MGLDLYAGPLTRDYAGLWETVIQQMGDAHGVEVQVVRPGAFGPFAGPVRYSVEHRIPLKLDH